MPKTPASRAPAASPTAGPGGAALVRSVKAGLPYSAVEAFRRTTGFTLETLAALLQTPQRTLLRRRSAGRLRADESDRLLRARRIFEQTVALFEGDADAARNWLRSPQRALSGHTPLEFAETEVGAREVETLIGRLEHGVFT